MKALGVEKNPDPLPGVLDVLQCKNGIDTIVEDYKMVPGWDNPYVQNHVVQPLQGALAVQEVELAYELPDAYFHIQTCDDGYDYRKLNEQLTAIMENTTVWERALSLRNPWIQQMEQYKTPEVLDRNFVKKYIEQVVVTFLGDRQAEISLTMKTQEWKQMLERIELEGADDGTKK